MGFKPRVDEVVELKLEAHGAGFSREAVVDLRSGRCVAVSAARERSGASFEMTTNTVELTIAPKPLQGLRATAATILAAGDTHVREQFSAMGVSYTARSRRRVATASFEIDVGAGTTYDHAWELVFDRVNQRT